MKNIARGAIALCLTCSLQVVSFNSFAQNDGDLDISFSSDGKQTADFGGNTDYGQSVAMQLDGKILVAGYSYYSNFFFAVARFNSDGTLDNSFSSDGIVTTAVGVDRCYAYSVAVQVDGKIVVAGFAAAATVNNYDFALVRYNSDGTLDNTFSSDGIVMTDFGSNYDYAYSVVVQADDKILVAGVATNGADFALARYNSDGTLDNTFSSDGIQTTDLGARDYINSVVLQSDGKIVAAGNTYNGTDNDFAVARWDADGLLDFSAMIDFGGGSEMMYDGDVAKSVAIQADGKIVVSGIAYNGSNNDFALVRLNNNGTIDNTFSSDGKLTTDISSSDERGNSGVLQTDGKIIVAGYSNSDFALARFHNELPTGIQTVAENKSISIFPNPVIDELTIDIDISDFEVKILTILGNVILTERNKKVLDISKYPQGTYILQVRSNDFLSNKIIIKQ